MSSIVLCSRPQRRANALLRLPSNGSEITMNGSIRSAVSLLVFALLALSVTGSQSAAHHVTFTLPFELIDNRVFINVRLNGRGPYHLILDTGAQGTISEHVAQQLGLSVEDAGTGQGVGEKKVHFGRAQIAQVQIGGLNLSNLEFNVTSFQDSPQVFGVKPEDGIIGRPVFEQMVVKHDYVHRRLTFTKPEDFVYSGSGVEVDFARPYQIPVVEAALDGVSGRFGIDTGARSSLLLYGRFSAQNKLREKYGAKVEGVTGWGIGGPVRSLLARAKTLRIGSVQVNDLVIRLSTQKTGLAASSEMAGLIGPDVLSQFDVTFDYSRNRIYFEKNAEYDRRDSYDRAGLWMGQNGRRFTVLDVISGGPAQEAGVRPGDAILAIDGEDTEKLVLPDIRQSMRRRPTGSKVVLLLESQGKRHTAVITLRDLV